MDKLSLYVSNFLPVKEHFVPQKNNACPGCGLALAVRQTYKAIENAIVKAKWELGTPDELSGGNTEVSFLKIPKSDGEIIICLDNEAGSSLNDILEKPHISESVSKGFKYVATACPSYPFDLFEKMKKAFDADGNAYIHILTPCPVEWQFDPESTVKIGKWAVESKVFPLYEIENGKTSITIEIPKARVVNEYLKTQKRFENLSEKEIKETQKTVNENYDKVSKIHKWVSMS